MDQNELGPLCKFFERSRYDIIQAKTNDGWGPLWTFAPCDPHAATKAAEMLMKMHRGGQLRVRHARRARLQDRRREVVTDVIVMTELPERVQTVAEIDGGIVIRVDAYLEDEALAALTASLSPPRS
ncbi:MAG: hypothetical protein ACRYFS_25150 [Janthinobacterium lividum]